MNIQITHSTVKHVDVALSVPHTTQIVYATYQHPQKLIQLDGVMGYE